MAMARPTVNNEIPTMSDTDKDKMFTCPYNKYHRISALKYPGHVAGCRKQYTGNRFVTCPFNARHEFPEVEYEWHVSCCPDKNFIERELTAATAPNVQPVTYDTNTVFNPAEDWESEANHVGFSISGIASMEPERNAYDEIEEFHNELEQSHRTLREQMEPDMSGLSKAQKKNLKRAQKRREKHLANGSDNGNEDDGDEELTEVQKESRLDQIAQEYAVPGRPTRGPFVDWISILNQFCQKNKINPPKYTEASNKHGGFGFAVLVKLERFYCDVYCETKKKAKQNAARSALLGLNVAVACPDPCRAPHMAGGNTERAREIEQRSTYLDSQVIPQARVIPGLNPSLSPSPLSSSSQPPSQMQSFTTQMAEMAIDRQNEDDWQVAGSRRRDPGRPSGNNKLRLAGIGRGRARR